MKSSRPGSILAALAGAFASDLDQSDEPELVERDDGIVPRLGGGALTC